jgi:hypothetical protein
MRLIKNTLNSLISDKEANRKEVFCRELLCRCIERSHGSQKGIDREENAERGTVHNISRQPGLALRRLAGGFFRL